MTNNEFLNWIADRLVHVYGESPNVDFVHKLRALAQPEQPKVRTGDCLLVGVCASEGHKIQKAQPEQEPVAWGFQNSAITGSNRWMMLREEIPANYQYGGALWTPLYTTPPQRTWVGLTDEEIDDIWRTHLHRDSRVQAIEAKLKEKNT